MNINVAADMAKETLHAVRQQKQDAAQKQVQVLDPNQTTGIQWAVAQQGAQVVQQTTNTQKAEIQNSSAKSMSLEIIAPSIEDAAILSTSVSMHEETVSFINISRLGLNPSALEGSYKEIYKKSKSHNLLLERFMTTIKLSGITMLLGLTGVDPDRIEEIKARAREEALNEIELKLSQDWAYTKAMLDITGA